MERKSVLVGLVMFCICAAGILCLSGTAEAALTSELVGEGAPDMPATYNLRIFTNNGMYNDSDEVVLKVEVRPVAGDDEKVEFKVVNDSEVDCSIARIYFDDGALLGVAEIVNGPGTDFEQPATPSDMPARNELDPPFVTTQDFSAGAENPPPHKGINPGEWLKIIFDLQEGFAYADVLEQLDELTLRIGAHVIAFPDVSSESAVTPEPATMIVLGLGGLVLCIKRRRAR